MAMNDYEVSKSRGQPVELYLFRYGSEVDDFFAYTDGERDVLHGGITYTPLPVDRGKIESKGKLDANEVQITVPRPSDVADLFRIYPPARIVTVTIRQGHIPNGDDPASYALGENFPVAWLGRVLEASREEAECVLTCESASASMKRPGLRRHYQWPCSLVLYGPRCRADKVAATVTCTVATVGGNRLTLDAPFLPQVPVDPADPLLGTQDAHTVAAYVGGIIQWAGPTGTEYQSILRTEGTAGLVLTGPTRGLLIGATVALSLGCPHTLAGCEALHNNVVNYGGHPFIPTFNPLGKNNHT